MIDYQKDYLLENQRVLLRPLQPTDYQYLLPFSTNEPALWQYSLAQAHTPELLRQYIDKAIENRQMQKEYPFIVFDKQAQQYAGSTRFYDIQPQYKTMQLGYTWYGKNFQGTGINPNCKYLLLQFALETLDNNRIELRADTLNQHSINAMKSIGCTQEGILRNNYIRPDGTLRSSVIFSVLQNEWNNHIKNHLAKKC
mgnify:CR=1 FL=1